MASTGIEMSRTHGRHAPASDVLGADADDDLRLYVEGEAPNDAPERLPPRSISSTQPTTVSWSRQFTAMHRKNWLLLSRKPIRLFIMLFSTLAFSLICLPIGLDDQEYRGLYGHQVGLDYCGVPTSRFLSDEHVFVFGSDGSLNELFRDGFLIIFIMLGPMVNAIMAFTFVQHEFGNQLVGSLRASGLRDSVYWASWFVPLMAINTANAFIGTIGLKLQPLYAFQNIHTFGIFASIFFLHFALVPASFLLVAMMRHMKRGGIVFIVVIIAALFIVPSALGNYDAWQPTWHADSGGLFWKNQNTLSAPNRGAHSYRAASPGNDGVIDPSVADLCHEPVLSDFEGHNLKTESQRAAMGDEDFFLGCYFTPSWHAAQWSSSSRRGKHMLPLYFMLPYFHFTGMWSNFVGFTAMPERRFTMEHLTMSPEQLAIESLPVPPNPKHGLTSDLFSQSPMMFVERRDVVDPCSHELNRFGSCQSLDTCPMPGREGALLCDDIYRCRAVHGEPTQDSPSAFKCLVYLILNAIMYMMLASYWAQVFPGLNGKAQKKTFFLSSDYWLGSGSVSHDDRRVAEEDEWFDGDTDKVVVRNVSKSYGEVGAVCDLSININRGEITAILGHNGAGKTTLSHIICCETSTSKGDVHVFGASVNRNPNSVRSMVGVCKQDDYLWHNLTAREHLELFAGLRGIPDEAIGPIVQKWLESVDLAGVQSHYSSTFSGGMKRRLSVALSTIGDRPLVILDEPTTGMDPVSRRFVWRHIDEVKKDRAIILTTHAMEEADLLADEIAIMRKGQLAAYGSPLQLKSDHGSALHFTLLVNKEDLADMAVHIQRFFADDEGAVDIGVAPTGNISVNIRSIAGRDGKGIDHNDENNGDASAADDESNHTNEDTGVSVEKLASFVGWLNGDKCKVQEYSFSNSSLEEVFLKVTGEEGPKDTEQPEPAPEAQSPPEAGGETAGESEGTSLTAGLAPGVLSELAGFKPNLSVLNQVRALLRFYVSRNWVWKSSRINYILSFLAILPTLFVGLATESRTEEMSYALVYPIGVVSLVLVSLSSVIYSDRADGLFQLMRTQGLLYESFLISVTSYAFIIQFIFTFVTFTLLYILPVFAEQEFCIEDSTGRNCLTRFGERTKVTRWQASSLDYDEIVDGVPVEIYAYSAPGGYGGVFLLILCFTLSIPGSVLASSFLPGYQFPLVIIACICLVASNAPDIIMEAMWSPRHQRERSYKFLEYSGKATGPLPRDRNYDSCQQTFNTSNLDEYFVNCAGLKTDYDFFEMDLPASASMLPQVGLFNGLLLTHRNRVTFASNIPDYVENVLIPNISGVKCSGSTCESPYISKLYWESTCYMFLGSLCLVGLGVGVAAVLAFPNERVLRLRRRIIHCFDVLRCRNYGAYASASPQEAHEYPANDDDGIRTCGEAIEERNTVDGLVQPFTEVVGTTGEAEEGTLSDIITVDHSNIPRDDIAPVLMHKLSKIYPSVGGRPPKKALQELSLHVPKGQCLGFLGKNGSGKTTALKILSGDHDPTSGFALVAGYDAALERIPVFERLGNCAQFDVIWKNCTVQVHLEFFARLKGVSHYQVERVAHTIARAVGLGSNDVYTRKAGALSGGMRRRLSIAMSLVGSPSVLVLDEPTTGLDPSTRNNIWELINSFNSHDRSVIITTHMMLEADALCSRIAIIADGKLKVVGTQQYLKNTYGSGYLLQLNLVQSGRESQERAMDFVRRELHPDAELTARQVKTLNINMPSDLNLERAFRALYGNKSGAEGGINQFVLSQASLEDVFVTLGG